MVCRISAKGSRSRKVIAVLAAAALLVAVVARASWAAEGTVAKIRVGCEEDFKPYAFVDVKGQPAGFGVDLIRAVADAMGLQITISPSTWDAAWNGLIAGKVDVLPVVARLPSRAVQVDFSLPHTETFDAFFVRAGKPVLRSIRSAQGKEIVVLRSDAAHHALLERQFVGRVIPVDTTAEMFALIDSGKHDALLYPKLLGTLEIRERRLQETVSAGPPIPDYKRVFSFAVRKGNAELLEKLNQGLLIVKTNGEYDRIYERWLSADDPWRTLRRYAGPAAAAAAGLIVAAAAWAVLLQLLVRKRTRELKAERQRLYSVLETLPVYVALLTRDHHVPFANRFFRERFGESDGKRCYEYLFKRAEPCEECDTFTVLKTHAPHHWEWTGPDGRNYDVHDYPFADADGSTLILEMGIDITEQKRAEKALQDMNLLLEQRVGERTTELRAANAGLLDSRRAALNLMEDSVAARRKAEEVSVELRREVAERKKAEEELQRAHEELELRVRERTQDLVKAVDSLHQQMEARAYAENDLRKSGEKLLKTLESITDGFFTLDREWRFTHVNSETLRLFRKERDELIGRSLWELDPNLVGTITEEQYRKAVEVQVPVTFEAFSSIMNRWIEVRAYPDGDGLTVYSHDITERKENERRTEITNALLKLFTQKFNRKEYLGAAIDLIRQWSGCRHAGLRIADGSGNIPYESCAGFDREFLEAESMVSLQRDHCACTRVVAGLPEPQDLPAMTPNGSFYSNNLKQFVEGLPGDQRSRFRGMCVKCGYTSIAVIPVRHRDRVLGAIHFADEREGIVPLKSVEFLEHMAFIVGEVIYRFEIEEERSRLASAVQSVAEGVVVADTRGIVQYANPAFERITGYARDEIVGRDLHILDSGKHNELFYAGMREALARDGVWSGQLINKKKDGTLYFEECTTSPVRDQSGEIVDYVSVKRDITEKLRLESIAESVSTMDSIGAVFSGVRHEIGNPVNSMNMILGILRAKLDSLPLENVREYLVRMTDQVGRIEYLLRSLKTFNLYESQEPQDVSVSEFMERFMPLVRDDFRKRDITVESIVPPDAGWMHTDPRALQQVLLNIMTNASDAVAGREDATVSIAVEHSGGMVRLQVKDNGCGIPEDKLGEIFKPFYTTKKQGTGLGLVIVRKMLTTMGGTITIQSSGGAGTVVDIAIPEGTHGTNEGE